MLYVDIPTQADLQDLALARTPASVSIYLPTTPVSGEISGDRIALKNLAKEAAKQLAAAGRGKREIEAIEAHLEVLADDEGFWRFQAHSLAIFVTPASVKTFRVPNALMPLVEVADRFHLKPLLRTVTFPNSAYLLALAEGSVRVLEISPDLPLSVVDVRDLPKDAASALGVSSMGVNTQSRRSDSASGQRGRITTFCRMVDRALRGLLSGQHIPLFLVADTALGASYRTINSYPGLAPFGVDRSPDDMSDADMAAHARGLLDRLHSDEVAAVRALHAERNSSGRSTTDIAQAARAATMGAIAILLVDIDTTVPGTIDEQSGAVRFAETESAANYCLIDEIARRALLSGARVLAVRAADLPGDTPLAAILRYAV